MLASLGVIVQFFLLTQNSRLPMILELTIGMPIMCTKNNFEPKEVDNGTLGHVIGYQLPKTTTTHHQVIDESFGYIVLVSSTLLEIVFIKLLGHDQVLDPKLLTLLASTQYWNEMYSSNFQTEVSLFLLNKFPLSLFLLSQLTNAKD